MFYMFWNTKFLGFLGFLEFLEFDLRSGYPLGISSDPRRQSLKYKLPAKF